MSFLKKKSFVFCMFTGVAATALVVSVFLLPATMLINREVVGMENIPLLSGICMGVAMFLSVQLVSLHRKKQVLELGLSIFGVWACLLFLVRIISGMNGELLTWLLVICVPAVIGMILGVIVFSAKGKRRKSIKRR